MIILDDDLVCGFWDRTQMPNIRVCTGQLEPMPGNMGPIPHYRCPLCGKYREVRWMLVKDSPYCECGHLFSQHNRKNICWQPDCDCTEFHQGPMPQDIV